MNLENLYKSDSVPEDDQIAVAKNIVIVVPERDFDLSAVLDRLGLSAYEVSVVWPKDSVDMLAEICAIRPRLVIQVGKRFFKKFPFMGQDGDWDTRFENRIRDSAADAFVGLHHHDEYSLKDGLGTVEKLVGLLKAQRRSFCCVTNHGSVGGWIRQYNACKDSGIKPIFGMEAYVSNYRGDDAEKKKEHRSANHLLLLARTKEGFDNIIKIHNDAQIDGFYYSPRANHEALGQWGSGVIGTSACLAGEIPRFLMEGNEAEAIKVYETYNEAFDKFYIELQVIEFEMQRELNRLLIPFGKKMGAEFILTCDSHYLEPDHADTHDLLLMMRQGKTILDKQEKEDDVWNFDVRNLHYRNTDEVRNVFEEGYVDKSGDKQEPFKDELFTDEVMTEAMGNTRKVAVESEDIELDSEIKLPKLYDNSEKILRKKVNEGFKRRELDEKPDKDVYYERVRHEFEVITKLGWADYFLVMDRIITEAVEEFGEWAVGYGRGSAAGSLVSYCLGLTDVDPIEWRLLFERFLDEGRPDPPDIDTDFDPRIRGWVKKRIVEMFGEDNTCSIGTYSTYKTKAVILDVAKVLGLDYHEANTVTKKLEPLRSFDTDDGEEEIVDKMSFEDLCKHYPELLDYFEKNPEVFLHAEVIRNQIRNMGTHAGGVIISNLNLKGRIPVLWDKGGNQVISAWAEAGGTTELSSVGLVKFDILGLNNLPIISDCIKIVEEMTGIKIPRREVPIDNNEAIRESSKTDLVGIFQLDNPATRPTVDAVGMESLEDISAITSLLRPGPKDMGMDMEYARRKHGQSYDIPDFMKEIMADTYGVLTYQEQAMKISQALCGFTGPESNKLRKAMGKKLPEVMEEMKAKFINGAKTRVNAGEISEHDVEVIWHLIESFAGYGFNRSHAVSYSIISSVELWLKYRYPGPYITALLNNTDRGKKKHGSLNILVDYVNYARKHNIAVVAPNVNTSKSGFTMSGEGIMFSLGHVKNVASSAQVIESYQPFDSMEDFHERVYNEGVVKTGKNAGKPRKTKPTKKVVESLIAAGAFDCFGKGLKMIGYSDEYTWRQQAMDEYYRLRKGKEDPPHYSDDEWAVKEAEVLGLCLSREPLVKQYKKQIESKGWISIGDEACKEKIIAFGRIDGVKPHTSKKGNSMFIVNMSDDMDSLMFYVFEGGKQRFRDELKIGDIAAIPLNRFDDGGQRFYDEDRESVVVVR